MTPLRIPTAPREAWEAVRTIQSFARARYELRGARVGARVRCYGPMRVRGARGIEVASRAVFLGGMIPAEITCDDGAAITIGPQGIYNYGFSISARQRVTVGARCRFGSLVNVRDDDGRRRAPVVIEDDVWLAHGAVVEPGVTIGRGSVVSAGAVVYADVPPGMLATGNPAVFAPLGTGASAAPASRPPPKVWGGPYPRTRAGVRAAIIEWLDDTRHFGDAESLISSDEASLREGGLVDSLGLVQLVLMLEQRFGVNIDREVVGRPGSQCIRSLVDLVMAPRESAK